MGKNGGPVLSHSYLNFPPLEVSDFIPFYHNPLHFDGVFLHQKYVVEGRSATQIADEIFSSKSTVLKALKAHGIAVLEAHRHHGNPAEVRFGKKVWGGREVDHAAEQKVIEAVSQMRSSNMGLRQIARLLTQMKIPTKGNKTKWHPEMIRRILVRKKLHRIDS